MIAIETFRCEYDGRMVDVTAGVTHVADGHELAGRYPHRFRREDAADPQGRGCHYRTGTARPGMREVPELRTGPARFEVMLTRDAEEAIKRELFIRSDEIDELADAATRLFGRACETG
jgi:hypothetical protein